MRHHPPRPHFEKVPYAGAHLDYRPIKSRQQLAWSTGNYAVIGTTLQPVGENLCEALDIRAGSRVRDAAAGNGNASLAAARRWCEITSTDYAPDLLETARRRRRSSVRRRRVRRLLAHRNSRALRSTS